MRQKNVDMIVEALENTNYLNIFFQSGANLAFNIGMIDSNTNQYKKPWNKLKDFQKEAQLEIYLDKIKKTDNYLYKIITSKKELYCDKSMNTKIIYDEKNGYILDISK